MCVHALISRWCGTYSLYKTRMHVRRRMPYTECRRQHTARCDSMQLDPTICALPSVHTHKHVYGMEDMKRRNSNPTAVAVAADAAQTFSSHPACCTFVCFSCFECRANAEDGLGRASCCGARDRCQQHTNTRTHVYTEQKICTWTKCGCVWLEKELEVYAKLANKPLKVIFSDSMGLKYLIN